MNNEWNKLCITDKTGQKFWNRIASPLSTMPEIRNLKRHLEAAATHPRLYTMLDLDSAVILLNGEVYQEQKWTQEDEDILASLSA